MRSGADPFSGLPVVVKNLLIINVIFYLLKLTSMVHFNGLDIDDLLALHYYSSPLFRPWQLVTHMFMHADFGHLFFNMLALFMLAPRLEYKWGSQRFLTFYMITGVGAAVLYSLVHVVEYQRVVEVLTSSEMATIRNNGYDILKGGQNYVKPNWASYNSLQYGYMLGASGAIYGVLLAFGMTFPDVELMFFPIFIPIKAKYFVAILGAIEVYGSIKANPDDNVAHIAHLGGMLVSYVLIRLWRGRGGGNQFGWDR
jgi:membrane associated rhomboid family serine protease